MRISYGFIIAGLVLLSCRPAQEKNKFTLYYNQGEQLYLKHCSNCHQPNGTGLGRVYPPLRQSDYLKNNFESVLCLMRYGVEGPLLVNGKEYNQAMPGIPVLTDLEVAEIATYIYNSWEHQRGLVDVAEASRVLRVCR
jgi:mono/diheme cytochrome c family protein